MKKILFFLGLIISATLAQAYQTKSAPRPNFSPKPAENAEQVPGQQGVQTRTFSSYGTRQGTSWRQGVKTETVTTPSVTETKAQEKEFTPIPQLPAEKPVNKKDNAKKAAVETPTPAPAAKATPTAASTQPATTEGMPAAMKEQLQGLQKMMSGLGAMGGGDPAAGGAAGGMPDLSSLLNGMPGAQQPKK